MNLALGQYKQNTFIYCGIIATDLHHIGQCNFPQSVQNAIMVYSWSESTVEKWSDNNIGQYCVNDTSNGPKKRHLN